MASKFLNQIVGTTTLVVVSVIVLPGLLDGKKKYYQEECITIPLFPKPDHQQESKIISSVTQSLTVNQGKLAGVSNLTEQKLLTVKSYVIQLGALKNAIKTNDIIEKLRLSGYCAFTIPLIPIQGQMTRIYVGPDTSKTKLHTFLPKLQRMFGLGGVVKPYNTH
ncbi:SPOR domain-containing protein [Pantoea sp. Nvir]|uniref:SPOR domain-containing protein n=1 Tax=Pantoea sp. Nvir TaxID=2576760 RepID=UPI0027FCAF53|nr:SPOR domain-containing protein [Pantoea sp. Nvir]CAJ0992096.1 Cell division protein DedD [Pantoea sp. Nvir]